MEFLPRTLFCGAIAGLHRPHLSQGFRAAARRWAKDGYLRAGCGRESVCIRRRVSSCWSDGNSETKNLSGNMWVSCSMSPSSAATSSHLARAFVPESEILLVVFDAGDSRPVCRLDDQLGEFVPGRFFDKGNGHKGLQISKNQAAARAEKRIRRAGRIHVRRPGKKGRVPV